MGVFQNNLMGAAAAAASAGGAGFYDYQIDASCRFDNGANAEMVRTLNTTATNRDLYTFSTWIKISTISVYQYLFAGETDNTNYDIIGLYNDNTLRIVWQRGGSSGEVYAPNLYRDTSAWMHIVVQYDTTQSDASNRIKVYINGVQSTLSESRWSGMISQNEDLELNANGNKVTVGSSYSYDNFIKSYMAQTAGIDGSVVAIGDLGESKNGVWIPKDLSGLTFGDNGFLLDYASSSDMGNDVSGNNNDFTPASISAHDQMIDSPTFSSTDGNGGNFCTWNPLDKYNYNQPSEGNLRALTAGNNGTQTATFGVSSGKWYFEARNGSAGSGSVNRMIGIMKVATDMSATPYNNSDCYLYYDYDGNLYNGGDQGAYGNSWLADGDKIGVAIDLDNGAMWFSKNGTWQNSATQGEIEAGTTTNAAFTSLSGDYKIMITKTGGTSSDDPHDANFGQDDTFAGTDTGTAGPYADSTGYGKFYYDPPDNFLALCAGNLPTADAVDPAETDDDYPQKLFTALAYTGDDGGSQTTGFQPDLVWVKARSTGQSNGLWDSTRGTTKILISNENDAEGTSSGLTSFNSTGYTMGTYYNQSSNTYVSWSWRATGGTTASNSEGNITSTIQANTTSGFSILTYTGSGGTVDGANPTLGHGLESAPECLMFKCRSDGSTNWVAWHSGIGGANKYMILNTDAAVATDTAWLSNTAPSSTLITTDNGGWGAVNGSSRTYVCYAWHSVEGFSKFGSYVGNGDADGTFVYTGFRPSMIFVKLLASAGDWWIEDTARDTYNPASKYISWDRTDSEATGIPVDFLSNGFKIRSASGDFNSDGGTIIYGAWAENPFQYSTAR
jgi:hypothetical protein